MSDVAKLLGYSQRLYDRAHLLAVRQNDLIIDAPVVLVPPRTSRVRFKYVVCSVRILSLDLHIYDGQRDFRIGLQPSDAVSCTVIWSEDAYRSSNIR